MKNKILIIEDEEAIIHILSSILSANEYLPLAAKTGEEGLLMAASHQPDAILLDLGLPDRDGIEVLNQLRKWYGRPVLIVSARDQEREKVEALDLGADDYITKPFGTPELLARIRAALRSDAKRFSAEELPPAAYHVGGLRIDFDKRQVCLGDGEVHLTLNEFRIVALLARNPGKVHTYDGIMEAVWGPYVRGDNKILRVNMANIRRKLEENPGEPRYILTELGVGYRMAEEEDL